jgi:hypothetical protein
MITMRKRLLQLFFMRSHLPSSIVRLNLCQQRRRVSLRCCVCYGWIYCLYWLVWTTDISIVRVGTGSQASTISKNDSSMNYDNNWSYRGGAPFCVASEIAEETENVRPISIRTGAASSANMKPLTAVFLSSATVANAEQIPNSTVRQPEEKLSLNQILYRAGIRGLGGGIPGAIAGGIQVLSLMWLRTIINYQCRYGTTFIQALRTLLNDGGISRLYCGVSFALVQAPLARFVSTAANDGAESLLANLSFTKDWGPGRTTVVASIVVGLWRMLLMRKLYSSCDRFGFSVSVRNVACF